MRSRRRRRIARRRRAIGRSMRRNSLICAMMDKSEYSLRTMYNRRLVAVGARKNAFALHEYSATAAGMCGRLLSARKHILASMIKKFLRRTKRYLRHARRKRRRSVRKRARKERKERKKIAREVRARSTPEKRIRAHTTNTIDPR